MTGVKGKSPAWHTPSASPFFSDPKNLSLPDQACMDDDMGQLQGTPLPAPNTPDLTLTGHEDTAQYALSCSTAAPLVSSGGTDHNVSL